MLLDFCSSYIPESLAQVEFGMLVIYFVLIYRVVQFQSKPQHTGT